MATEIPGTKLVLQDPGPSRMVMTEAELRDRRTRRFMEDLAATQNVVPYDDVEMMDDEDRRAASRDSDALFGGSRLQSHRAHLDALLQQAEQDRVRLRKR